MQLQLTLQKVHKSPTQTKSMLNFSPTKQVLVETWVRKSHKSHEFEREKEMEPCSFGFWRVWRLGIHGGQSCSPQRRCSSNFGAKMQCEEGRKCRLGARCDRASPNGERRKGIILSDFSSPPPDQTVSDSRIFLPFTFSNICINCHLYSCSTSEKF